MALTLPRRRRKGKGLFGAFHGSVAPERRRFLDVGQRREALAEQRGQVSIAVTIMASIRELINTQLNPLEEVNHGSV
ncbi:MAG: hypothetical protein ACR2K0_05045 [Acidimicrobiales bacterium]